MIGRRRRNCGNGAEVATAVLLRVNGTDHELAVGPSETLLQVLRGPLGLTGSKEGCGRGECGACTVLVGGVPVLSCISLAARIEDEVVTIEGIVQRDGDLRCAFAEHGGFQCGFCTPGQLVSASALLRGGGHPSEHDVRHAMSGNICRCTGYVGIVEAVRETAERRVTGARS